jgi:hypothetical protein
VQDLQQGGGGGNVLWGGGGAFSAKPLRGRPGRGFQSVALDATVQKMPVTPPTTHDLHAASFRRLQGRHVPMTSASSHGPLTARLTRAVGGPSSFWGPPALHPSRGCVRGPGSRGLLSVFWILGYPGPPAPGPLQRPSFGPGETTTEAIGEDPHEEAPHEENDD